MSRRVVARRSQPDARDIALHTDHPGRMTLEETFRALYEAFGDARDADAALALFATDDDIYFAGSEVGEVARGRTELEAMLRWLATLDETLDFEWTTLDVRSEGDVAWVAADGTLNCGPYRTLGILVRRTTARGRIDPHDARAHRRLDRVAGVRARHGLEHRPAHPASGPVAGALRLGVLRGRAGWRARRRRTGRL